MRRPETPQAVLVIAHRGASHVRPENTLLSFDEALRRGCDGVELDVQLTNDGVPVVYHDRTLTRAGGGRRRVAAVDLVELRRLDVGLRSSPSFRGQRIPTLEEVLARYGGRTRLLIEIKAREGRRAESRHRELTRAVIGLLKTHGIEKNVDLLSFNPIVLDEAEKIAPHLRRVLNVRPGPLLSASQRRLLPSLHAVSADVRTLGTRFASQLQRSGGRLLVFTCNTPRRVEQALRAGAAGIISNRPDWLAARLRGDSA